MASDRETSQQRTVVSELCQLYESASARRLYDESVTEVEHALQCAALAVAADAADHMVVAALLHDVGHLTLDGAGPIDEQSRSNAPVDHRHEQIGARLLAKWFGPQVTAPVALHVAAKRYLCTTDASYRAALSPASVRSLGLQGGAMSSAELRSFEQHPRARDAVQLRRWDDDAKLEGLTVPPFEHYLDVIAEALDLAGGSTGG